MYNFIAILIHFASVVSQSALLAKSYLSAQGLAATGFSVAMSLSAASMAVSLYLFASYICSLRMRVLTALAPAVLLWRQRLNLAICLLLSPLALGSLTLEVLSHWMHDLALYSYAGLGYALCAGFALVVRLQHLGAITGR